MKRIIAIVVTVAIAAAGLANAISAVAPFAPHRNETFGAIEWGSYRSVTAMVGFARVSIIGDAGALQVGDFPFLPPCSSRHALYASGGNVRWTFTEDVRGFGGMFRLTALGAPVRGMKIRFLDVRGVLVGSAEATLTQETWQWRGFASKVPFRHAEVHSVGESSGYVGMDDLRVRL